MVQGWESGLSGHRALQNQACCGGQSALFYPAPIAERPGSEPETAVAIRAPELEKPVSPVGAG